MVPPLQSPKDQVRQLLFEARQKLSDRAFDEAESLYEQVLGLDPTEEAAFDGLEQVESQRLVSQEGVLSANWQQQYAAGADESVDYPPALAHDIFDTLPPNPTMPPGEAGLDGDTTPPSVEIDLTEPPNAEEPDVQVHDAEALPDKGGVTTGGNPSIDPFKWPQRQLSDPDLDGASREGVSADGRTKEVAQAEVRDPNRSPSGPMAAPVKSHSPPVEKVESVMPAPPALPDLIPEVRAREVLGKPQALSPSIPVGRDEPIYAFNQQRTIDLTIETYDEDVDEDDDTVSALLHMAHRRHDAGDFSGSLEFVNKVLGFQHDHAVATALGELNHSSLLEMYRARLGDLNRAPELRLRQQEYVWQSLTHQEGFVLSLVDGQTRYTDILEIAAMPVFEVTRILSKLVELQIIG